MKNDYLYTSINSRVEDLIVVEDTTYFWGKSLEERSHFVEILSRKPTSNVHYEQLEWVDNETVRRVSDSSEYSLRSIASMTSLLTLHKTANVTIDVTGLDNRICASLLRNAIELSRTSMALNVVVIYAEPENYKIREFKTEGVYVDLSEKIEGISPLPGFASIFPQSDEDTLLVALLGFEGGRFAHLLENIQPPREQVIPVIGVPGFRPEYPFVAYWGNRRPLEETETWRKVQYVAANSLVEVYMFLTRLTRKNPNSKIKLAPIGTKPHAIAAMLFTIKNPTIVELVYDNPKRKKQRTEGIGNIIECKVSKLIREN